MKNDGLDYLERAIACLRDARRAFFEGEHGQVPGYIQQAMEWAHLSQRALRPRTLVEVFGAEEGE